MKSGSRLSSCGTTPRRARACLACAGTAWPSTSTAPSSNGVRPSKARKVVVLPAERCINGTGSVRRSACWACCCLP
ncbi:Uncharacterised protein [Bordetella pertussis]|nr:Uncharacterised protein [Bordetella pertussis]